MSGARQRIGKNIRKLLDAKKQTAEELANAIDIDKAHISRILSGQRSPSIELLEDVAAELKVDIQDLLKP